jgi:cobalt-zinc-cadmium efflux system outer membrane protein
MSAGAPSPSCTRFLALAACVAPVLAACVSVKPVTLTTKEASANFEARRLDDAGLRRFATQPAAGFTFWPPEHWDAHALDVAALYFSPPLAVARARWRVADAAIVSADEIPNPSLNLSAQYVSNAAAGVPAWVVAASVVQIIETAGKRDLRVARARYLSEAARLDTLDVAWETTGAVNQALLDIAIAQHRLTALGRQTAALYVLAGIAEKRVQAGLESSLALTTARTALSKAVIEREAAATALTDAQHRLARAVGVPAQSLPLDRLSLARPVGTLPPDVVQSMRERALLNRADLLARLAAYAASDTALQLETARQYPDVELGPGYEYDQGSNKWGLSLGVQIPVFNQHRGPIGEAEAARRQAADEFLATQARVIGDVDRAFADYEAAVRTDRTAAQLLRSQADRLVARRALFERGEIDRAALLAADVEAAGAELDKATAEGDLAKARLALEQATQYPLSGLDPAALLVAKGG